MDSITHITVGALIGEVALKKSLGKQRMLVGAVAQSLPDIDFAAALWMTPADNLLAHRGFTHALLFMLLAAGFCGNITTRWYKKHGVAFLTWFLFFAGQMTLHLLIDMMNAYGIALLEPFSHQRFSFNILFVADPLFSIAPMIVSVVLLILNNNNLSRRNWAIAGLCFSLGYFLIAGYNKMITDTAVKRTLANRNIPHVRYFTTPTPLNSFLWYIVVDQGPNYLIGYRSVFDKSEIVFTDFTKNDSLASKIDQAELKKLKRFSQNYYRITRQNDSLIFNDLRFGQVFGWIDPAAPFVFQFHLTHTNESLLALQKGRLEGWNRYTLHSTLKRIAGLKE